ncbi:MAG: hypothetical protein PWP23_1009 [Candidatus Sumerlaeota bacterium]|nr:hypothetical protein [Candidatus Sumerlaeota bacterium]
MGTKTKLPLDIKPPEMVARELIYPRRDIWILLAVCGVVRLAFLPINAGEYTDGVLQARQFVDPVGIWPPLYSALVYPLKFVLGYLWAGRLVSVVASVLALWPIYKMTQRFFGTRAALYAGIFYITAPVANRWGVRLMTDATFSLFFWWACERLAFASDERSRDTAFRAFGWGCIASVLAALTRYQGMLLYFPVLAVLVILTRRFGKIPFRPALWLLGYALLPGWIFLTSDSFIHVDQFANRGLNNHWRYVMSLNAEAFLAYFPYYLTYTVFVCALVGIFWTRQRRGPFFGWMMLYVAVVLLLFQSAFSSFQERYFLPLMGFFWVLAGSGMYAIQERWLRQTRPLMKRTFPYLLILIYAWPTGWTMAVMLGQRQAWGDLAAASRWVGAEAPEDAAIFTNDSYPTERMVLGAKKVSFFSGRNARFLNESFVPSPPYRTTFDGRTIARPPQKLLEVGDYVVLSDLYASEIYLDYLRKFYVLDEVHEPFTANVLPLLPENMSIEYPGTNQNANAWLHRYDWQHFTTRVFRVEALR